MLEAESKPGPQGDRRYYVNKKIALTLSGMEPTAFRLVAVPEPIPTQHSPQIYRKTKIIKIFNADKDINTSGGEK